MTPMAIACVIVVLVSTALDLIHIWRWRGRLENLEKEVAELNARLSAGSAAANAPVNPLY